MLFLSECSRSRYTLFLFIDCFIHPVIKKLKKISECFFNVQICSFLLHSRFCFQAQQPRKIAPISMQPWSKILRGKKKIANDSQSLIINFGPSHRNKRVGQGFFEMFWKRKRQGEGIPSPPTKYIVSQAIFPWGHGHP